MRIEAFDFDLPADLIATRPARPRDAARLLAVGAELNDRIVRDLPDLLRPDDLLVVNDTKVIPALLSGRRGDTSVEIMLHQPVEDAGAGGDGAVWRAFARPARRLRPGDRIAFAADLWAEVSAKGAGGEVTLRFARAPAALMAALARAGAMPLPPYIRKIRPVDARDDGDYQTLFAARPGAVAAPTAALHFTPELLAALDARGIARATLTLHVGAGTFLPVRGQDTDDHIMHAERGHLGAEAAAAINAAKAAGRRVVAVGTTALRLLESAAEGEGRVGAFEGDTRLFITPGFRFRIVDGLLTNFHLPRSTLFMLVAAFAGLERMHAAYSHAIAARYRFYSYGDVSLLWPGPRLAPGSAA